MKIAMFDMIFCLITYGVEVNNMEFKLSTTVVIECSSFVFLKTLIVLVIWFFNHMT